MCHLTLSLPGWLEVGAFTCPSGPALPCTGHRLLGLSWKTQSQAVVSPLAWEAAGLVGGGGHQARPVPVVQEGVSLGIGAVPRIRAPRTVATCCLLGPASLLRQ